MIEGNRFKLTGSHVSLSLIILLLTFILLWELKKDPMVTTQFSAPDQPTVSSSVLGDAPTNSSVSTNSAEQTKEVDSYSPTREEKNVTVENFALPPKNSETSSSSEVGGCNYVKGKWVPDRRRPFYSGLGCKWLTKHWACRLTQRTDFSYEGYRWQPNGCEMPEFDPRAFLRRMQDKTIAFIGDSLGRQQFQSLMCMATAGEESSEVEDVGREYNLVKPPGSIRPDGWAYRFRNTNTTMLYYWSATLGELDRVNITDPDSAVAMHLDPPPAFLKQHLHRFNVLVLNTGHHWNNGKFKANHWVIYVDGKPNEDTQLAKIQNAKNFKIYSLIRWLDSQLSLRPGFKAFFRTSSPRHFTIGEWNTKGICNNTIPMTRGSEVWQDGSSDEVVEVAVNGTRVKILDITALSALRDEAHKSNYGIKGLKSTYDCLHWCLPGIPDTWNEILIAQLYIGIF